MNIDISEQIRNNEQLDRYQRRAHVSDIERYSRPCAAVKLVWNTAGPIAWKTYELCKIKQTMPMTASFEIDWLVKVLEC